MRGDCVIVVCAVTLVLACSHGGTEPSDGEPVASVDVLPASLNLTVGDTARLSATLRDSAAIPITGQPIGWASLNGSVASVSSEGLVKGVAPGTTQVSAWSESKADTAVVVVSAAPPAAECAAPQDEWIWCDDFETNRLASYFEIDTAGGRFARTSGVGRNGSTGMRARWNVGNTGAGSLHLAFGRTPQAYFAPVDAGTEDYREIYYRHWIRLQDGWTGGGADKLSRAIIFASPSSWAEAAVAHVYSGGPGAEQDYLFVDPASGTDAAGTLKTTTYNDFANFRWLGAVKSQLAMFAASNAGTWYCVEVRVKLNTADASDGLIQVWINDALQIEKTGMNWVGAFNAYGINAVFLEQYWNAGAPATRERHLDNLVVSTQRIGC